MSFELDQSTALESAGEGRLAAQISDGWDIGNTPNGGYLMALLGRALLTVTDKPHLFSLSLHFQSRTAAGPAEIALEPLRQGGRVGFGAARLLQDGQETVRATGVSGDFAALDGPRFHLSEPPPVDWPEKFYQLPLPIRFHERLRFSLQPATGKRLAKGGDGETCEIVGRIHLADERPTDLLALLLFADAFPPTIFSHSGQGSWVPTLEMTTQLRGIPAPGPVLARFTSRHLSGGLIEEDGELWDAEGQLVAVSRQLALYRPPAKPA